MTRQYYVHVYHVVRSKFLVEANNTEEAMLKTENLNYKDALETEEAEEVTNYLVDVVGDESYEHSQWYNVDREPVKAG